MTAPLTALTECRTALNTARQAVLSSEASLTGARRTRATELAEMIADAIAFADRLRFVVVGDLRAEQCAEEECSSLPFIPASLRPVNSD